MSRVPVITTAEAYLYAFIVKWKCLSSQVFVFFTYPNNTENR